MKGRQFLFSPNATLHTRLYFLGQSFVRISKTLIFLPPQSALHGPSALVFGITLALLVRVPNFTCRPSLIHIGRKADPLFERFRYSHRGFFTFAVLPNPGHGGRYIALPIVIFLCLTLLGLYELFYQHVFR